MSKNRNSLLLTAAASCGVLNRIASLIIFGKGTPKDNIPEKDFNYIIMGNFEETGVCVLFYFNEFVYWGVKEGETITIEGNFREIKYIKDFHSGKIVFKNIIMGECKIIKL